MHRFIPDDILSEIFYIAMHQSDADTQNFDSAVPTVSYLSSADPIKIGHVCSHWRIVAINTSELWSTICIDHPGRSHINLTRIWIERARTRPLYLTLKTERSRELDSTSFIEILDLLVEKLDQWTEIEFDIPSQVMVPFSQMLESTDMGFQQLKSATILAQNYNYSSFKLIEHAHAPEGLAIDSIWKKIHSSPRLKQVNWKRLYEGRPTPDHCQWNKLTSIRLDYHISIDRILEILSTSPNMADFRVGSLSKSLVSTKITYSAPITLPNMHTLHIITPDDLGELFGNITAPKLQNLHITNGPLLYGQEEHPFEHDPDIIKQFLERSQCQLKDVWIRNLPVNQDDFRSYIAHPAFQTVESLRITSSDLVNDAIIRLLTLDHVNMNLMLGLKSIWFETREAEITDGLLGAMIMSRWRLHSGMGNATRQRTTAIKVVRLTRDYWLDFGPKDMEIFSQILEEGLDISIDPGVLKVHGRDSYIAR